MENRDEEFIEAMRAAVAEKGSDYTYKTPDDFGMCVYRYRNEPSCLIGYALDKMGITHLPLGNPYGYDLEDAGEAAQVLREFECFSEHIIEAAGLAQEAQDYGKRWDYSLDLFETRVNKANV